MPVEQIVALLVAERDRINRAIETLQGAKRRGRPPKYAIAGDVVNSAPKKRGRTFSAAQRKAQAEKMRLIWAKRRRAAGKEAS